MGDDSPRCFVAGRDGLKVTENDVEQLTKDYMEIRGWYGYRQHVGVFRTKYGGWITVGEKGMADWRFEHPRHGVVHIECKRPKGKPKPHQSRWIREKRARGFTVWVVDGLESLDEQYLSNFGGARHGKARRGVAGQGKGTDGQSK
jgi:hypothetical protein